MEVNKISIKLLGDFWAIPNVKVDTELNYSNLTIGNLETPILNYDELKKRAKAGPSIKGSGLDFENICKQFDNLSLVLSNNHIMDYGEIGLNQTINILKKNNISYCGVGKNINEAQKPLILNVKNIKVAIISVAEIQFGIAQHNTDGYNPFTSKIYAQIIDLKKTCELLIISIHASSEMFPIPSPDWQDTMRSLIDVGADIIHGHHSHVPQGYEKYKQGIIFYGLGNFIVNPNKWEQYNNTLWAITPVINYENSKLELELKTTVIEEKENNIIIRYANETEFSEHLEYLKYCNTALSDRKLLIGLWQELSVKMYKMYFGKWLEFEKQNNDIPKLTLRNKLGKIKRACKELFITKKKIEIAPKNNKMQYLLWYHLFACESHKKIIETAIGVLSEEIKDLRDMNTSKIINKYFQ